MVPLSLIMDARPTVSIPESSKVRELYVRPPLPGDYTFSRDKALFSWRNFFITADRLIKLYEKSPLRPLRQRGVAIAEQWIIDHQEPSGDWGGIQPAMLNSVLALHTIGYPNDHPAMARGLAALANFTIETDDSLVLQSCVSPVWDSALALKALLDSGFPDHHPAVVRAAEWLLAREVRKPGDWQIKSPGLQPGGWAFEFHNDWYPDVDDSAFVIMAIKDVSTDDPKARDSAIRRGLSWCLGMQSKNGGWGAFDKDNTKHLLNKIPFADLEALIDPPTADLTGRMLELLGSFDYELSHPAVQRALAFVKKEQESEGSWWGRWGVNHIYGTWSVLCGLAAIREEMSQPYIQRAVNWLKEKQNLDGGWGESCKSYHDSSLAGTGESTPSQTAWALLGLMAAGEVHSPGVIRGIAYLLEKQNDDGSWNEDQYTGTGFPKYFMIKYHIYRNCFPLSALGCYRRLTDRTR
jgi:squalene-hopene/tetraprenyl-beta-curcumene cyclase